MQGAGGDMVTQLLPQKPHAEIKLVLLVNTGCHPSKCLGIIAENISLFYIQEENQAWFQKSEKADD